jgi:hypothetical protein
VTKGIRIEGTKKKSKLRTTPEKKKVVKSSAHRDMTPEKGIIRTVKISPNTKLNKMEQSLLEEDIEEDNLYLGRRVDHSSSKKSNRMLRFNSSNKAASKFNPELVQDSASKRQAKPIEKILS